MCRRTRSTSTPRAFRSSSRKATSRTAITLFAAARDHRNWFGFRVAGSTISFESRTDGRPSAKSVPYDAEQHRHLRLRKSDVANLVVWETSPDGNTWSVQYAESPEVAFAGMQAVLSAGTASAVSGGGSAVFDNFILEVKR